MAAAQRRLYNCCWTCFGSACRVKFQRHYMRFMCMSELSCEAASQNPSHYFDIHHADDGDPNSCGVAGKLYRLHP